ncbi:MAG: cytochrome c [Rhodobacteraceae bacterium]|nr:cytochrome c [Paracoccaceae bacterium]
MKNCSAPESPRRAPPNRFAMVLLALACAAPAFAQTATRDSAATAWYTAAQADLGRRAFVANCAACHGSSMLTIFRRQSSAAKYFNFISGSMPKHLPGSLPEADYVSIVAYMLRTAGFPPGERELTSERAVLRQIIPADGHGN